MKLPVHRWGHGPMKALFLHGFTGSADAFGHLEPLLGDVVTASCVDLPGHRGAPLPLAPGSAGYAETVEALGALLEPGATLVGYSQGARLALAVAAAFPGRAGRLVLESGTPGLRQRSARARRRRTDDALADDIIAGGVEAFISRWEQLALFTGLRELSAADTVALRERRTSHDAHGLAGALRALGQGVQPDLWPALATLRLPVLLLSGARDAKYTRLARRMARDLPLGWHVAVAGAWHAPHLERPQAWASEVRAFLEVPWATEPVVMT